MAGPMEGKDSITRRRRRASQAPGPAGWGKSETKVVRLQNGAEQSTTASMEFSSESSVPSHPVQAPPPPTLSADATAMALARLRGATPQERARCSPSPPAQRSASRPGKARNRLISFEELPEWHRDNNHIRHGYRPISGSANVSLRSWSYLHNESVNIFSHLIPAIVFSLGEWYILEYLKSRYPNITGLQMFIFSFFLLCTVICFLISATYHTLMNHSNEAEKLWLRMDLVGIVVYKWGAFVSGIYMIFMCEPLQRKIYWAMIGVLGSINIIIMADPAFQTRQHRLFRTLVFSATAASGFAPLIHGCVMFGISLMMKQSGMPYYLTQFFFLASAGLVYATKFPETVWPGKFDILGSSHQCFHVLVLFAAVSHLTGILQAFDYSYKHRKCPSP